MTQTNLTLSLHVVIYQKLWSFVAKINLYPRNSHLLSWSNFYRRLRPSVFVLVYEYEEERKNEFVE